MVSYLTRASQVTIPKFSNLIELLIYRGQEQSKNSAYTYLQDGEIESERLTYQELDLKARAVAAYLQEQGVAGQRALLLYPSGLDFIVAFLGCLYAAVIAVPAYPPRRNQKMKRWQAIVDDCKAAIVLTTSSLLDGIQEQFLKEQTLSHLQCVATDGILNHWAGKWQQPEITEKTLAFLQYTSGSTGRPKGVMVSHHNLLHNERLIKMAFGHSEKTIFVGWLPLFHDMGLIGNVLQPLYLGIPSLLLPPEAFIRQPIRWLKAISQYKATTSGGPNFAYDLCVRKVTPEQCAGLDLSSWDIAFNGAEPVRADTLQRFSTAFAPYGFRHQAFYPCYGMAETTLFVSGGLKTAPPVTYNFSKTALEENRVELVEKAAAGQPTRTLVGCGQTFFDKINIVNPETHLPCAPNQVGEIWVDGASVAQGYWHQAETTPQIFQAHLADGSKGSFLRTGDLGFFYRGELFITGRLKDVIIIRGRNYYPQDIELTAANSHPALSENGGAAFSIDWEGEEKLVIVQEVARTHLRQLNQEEVREAMRRSVANEHEVQVHDIVLIKPASILKTSSGKIQRRACKTAYLEGQLAVVKPSAQQELAKEERKLLPLKVTGTAATPSESPLESIESRGERPPAPTSVNSDLFAEAAVSRQRADGLVHWLRDYGNHRINSRLIDERRSIPPYIVLDFGNQGIFGLQVAEKYGGLGLRNRDMVRVIEQMAAIDLSLATFVGVNNALGIRPIQLYATPEMRDEVLPILAQGRQLAAFAVTEPGAGSAVRSVASQAIPDGKGGWTLHGTKIWSGSSQWAGYINVFAQLMDDKNESQGFVGFLVKQGTAGLRLGPEAMTMGMRGMVQNTVYLEGVPVGPENLLGKPGEGFLAAQDTMMFARLGIAAMSLGGLKRCAQLMHRYASRRAISTGRLLDNPVSLNRLSELTASLAASEALVQVVTELMDAGRAVPEEAMVACKTSVPEFLGRATDNLLQLLGGRGYVESNGVPQLFRDARLFRIFEGPTETLNMHLGSSVLHGSEPLFRFLSETLEQPGIGQRLRAAAEEIKHRCLRQEGQFGDLPSTLRWAYSLIGEVATYSILLATLQSPYNHRRTAGSHQRAALWTQLQLERLIAQAQAMTPAESVWLGAETLTELVAEYTDTVGDVEQTLAGEDWELNDLLRRDFSAQGVEVAVGSQASPTGGGETVAVSTKVLGLTEQSCPPTVAAVQTWLVNWLSQELKIEPQAIKLNKSFADYGLDSVVAVELAEDLGNWLGRELDATIAWNFPTITSLAAHLVEGTPEAEGTAPVAPVAAIPRPPVSVTAFSDTATTLDELSAAEIAHLLSQEIAKR